MKKALALLTVFGTLALAGPGGSGYPHLLGGPGGSAGYPHLLDGPGLGGGYLHDGPGNGGGYGKPAV